MKARTSSTALRIRVLVVDDQALIRRGMTLMLSVEPDIEVVGQASDGFEAVEMAQRLRPDVVPMELHMPRKGGVAATREIMLSLPGTHVLVLTTLDDEDTVFEAVRAGAHAYLLKDASEDGVGFESVALTEMPKKAGSRAQRHTLRTAACRRGRGTRAILPRSPTRGCR